MEKISSWFNKDEGKIFSITLFLHSIVLLVVYSGILFPSPNDDSVYHAYGIQIASLLGEGAYTLGAVYTHHWYPLFVGMLYWLTDTVMLYGVFCNALLIALSGILLYKTMLAYEVSRKVSFWSTLIVLNAYASLMYTTSLLLKEAWIIFLFIAMLFIAKKIVARHSFSWNKFVVFLIVFILLRNLRHPIAFAALIGFFAQWMFLQQRTLSYRLKYLAAMILIVSGLTFLLMGDGILKNRSIAQYVSPEFVHTVRRAYISGETTANLSVVKVKETATVANSGNGEEKVSYPLTETSYDFSAQSTAVSVVNAALGPFPWQLPLQKYAFAFLDIIILYTAYIFAGIALYRKKLAVTLPFIVIMLGLIASLALGVDNFGAMLRYRMPLTIVAAILAGIGIQSIFERKK